MHKIWLIFAQAVTVALAALFVVTTLKPQWLRSTPVAAPVTVTPIMAPAPVAGAAPVHSLREAAQRAVPAVVSITASKAPVRDNRADDPWLRFFFGNGAQRQQPQVGLGSGVIVSTSGYLLTNNHVVEGADDIEVALNDGRSAKARVVGTDPETDIAVLKIELDRLPVVALSRDDAVQVGDVVLAIGNPFNVGQTVTSGIVSALGRNQLGINTFENFIQTDAAINPGNSGGALVDVNGALIGINTAIYSRSGGSLGIGFAIPVDTARQVMQALITNGSVARGWIGVESRDVTPELARHFQLPRSDGVLIAGVLNGGPADQGGLRPGDIVIRVADTAVLNSAQLMNAVAALAPLSSAPFTVQRGERSLTLQLRVGQRPRPASR